MIMRDFFEAIWDLLKVIVYIAAFWLIMVLIFL